MSPQPTNPAERRPLETCGARRCVCGHDVFRHNEDRERGAVSDCRDCRCASFAWADPCANPKPCALHSGSPGGAGLADQSQAGGGPSGEQATRGTVARLNALHARMVRAHASNEDLLTVLAAIDEVLAQRQRAETSERVFAKLCESARAPRPASTPPHEQQNEPSSSPSRAPGDEPADGPPHHDYAWNAVESGFATLHDIKSVVQDLMEFAVRDGKRLDALEAGIGPSERPRGAEREPRTSDDWTMRGSRLGDGFVMLVDRGGRPVLDGILRDEAQKFVADNDRRSRVRRCADVVTVDRAAPPSMENEK